MPRMLPFPSRRLWAAAGAALSSALIVCGSVAVAQQDKYTISVPGGLSFAEFRGYEDWSVISLSKSEKHFAVTLGNPIALEAFRAGIPDNGKPFPDG
ncbi:cytochrome P460, partial [Salinarimonas soli]